MRNFLRISSGINVLPILHSIYRQPELWNENKLRTTHIQSPHTEVDDIWLRFNDLTAAKAAAEAKGRAESAPGPEYLGLMDEHESICYPAWHRIPEVRPIIFDLMRMIEGLRLGRVLITRLAPGKKIRAHVDGGSHAAYYERYHCFLQNAPGSIFRAGEETLHAKTGELWWFDNSKEHEVINNSAEDRITLIIDVGCKK